MLTYAGEIWPVLQREAAAIGVDRLLTLVALSWLILLSVLVSWLMYAISGIKARRRLRGELRSVYQQLAEVQRKYEDEVHWRTTAEDLNAPAQPTSS